MTPLLSLELSVRYGHRRILEGVCLDLAEGEALGVVGQSGSGKSTLALGILGLLDAQGGVAEGRLRFRGRDLMPLKERQWRELRGRDIALILQSATAALNPALRLESHFEEAWRAHSSLPWRAQRPRVFDLLQSLDLPGDPQFLRRYPGQVSLGQAQRVLIAMSLLHRPALLVADEPTSALDPVTAQEVLAGLRQANRSWGVSILYISHDVASVIALCTRVAVLLDGRMVETGPCARVVAHPQHPYTRRLVKAASALGCA